MMTLTDEQSQKVARLVVTNFKRALRKNRDLLRDEIYNEAYMTARACCTEKEAFVKARFQIIRILRGDKQHRERSIPRHTRDQDLLLDLLTTLSVLSPEELTLLKLRYRNGYTIYLTANQMHKTVRVVQREEKNILSKLATKLRDWNRKK